MPEEIIPPERQLMEGEQSRLITGIEDALGIVKAYIGISMERFSGTQTGDSRYDATLDFLRKALDSRPLEERAVAYSWLVTEKDEAKKKGYDEKAFVLRRCLQELYQNREEIVTQNHGITRERIGAMQEEAILGIAKSIANEYEDLTNNIVEGILRLARISEDAKIPSKLELRIKQYN